MLGFDLLNMERQRYSIEIEVIKTHHMEIIDLKNTTDKIEKDNSLERLRSR